MAETIKHKVVWGDTLSELAVKYGTTVNSIAVLNNIKNIHRIYVGQVLYIKGKPSSSGSSGGSGGGGTPAAPPNNVYVHVFGLQADTERTFFVQWSWGRANTKEYRVVWEYLTRNEYWFIGNDSKVTALESVYTAPANAIKVRVKVLPISETYKSNDKDVLYWTANWSNFYMYDLNDLPPKIPPTPTVTIKDYTLTASHNNLDMNSHEMQYEIVYNDTVTFKMGTVPILLNSASWSCNLNPGYKYRVRARSKRWGTYSEWSQFTDYQTTKPAAPAQILSCQATSKTSVLLSWTPVETAEKYSIEHTTKKEYFEGSNSITKINDITTTQYEITGLGTGERYFFRVKAVNSKGESGFTPIATVVIGTKPAAPTTWSSTSTAIVGEELILYWVHNSEDDSKETTAELYLDINGTTMTKTIVNNNPDETNKTSMYSLATAGMIEGAKVRWKVRTAGITKEYGDWSVERTVDIYAPPTLNLELLNNKGKPFNVLHSFPFYIRGTAGPSSQKAISFHVAIVAKSSYETVDEIGNVKMIMEGDEVYSQFFDISTELLVEIMPGSVDLQNNVEYDVTCTVAMDSGLSTSQTNTISVSWIDEIFTPNAEMTLDKETLAVYVRPYCEYYPDIYYQVAYEQPSNYIKNPSQVLYGRPASNHTSNIIELEIDLDRIKQDLSSVYNYSIQVIVSNAKAVPVEGSGKYYRIGGEVVLIYSDGSREYPGAYVNADVDSRNFQNTNARLSSNFRVNQGKTLTGISARMTIQGLASGDVTVLKPMIRKGENQSAYEEPKWIRTSVTLPKLEGISVDEAFTHQYNDIVYAGMNQGVLTHFCIVRSELAVQVPDVAMSVYRREFNGTFTEIGKDIDNTKYTFVTDPHPALDYARYRIVAISKTTGSVSYVDLPAFPVGEKSIVIQWNERWTNYNAIESISTEKPAWAGSMLKLPYNIDVSDSNDNDVTLVDYIGRQHPVSYYGTQVGSKATWNVDIPRQDVDTIYALRRLAIWMGDVYVREPSGSGYWANVNVSFSQTHKETVIPVTISLKRVEGGV